MGSVTSHGCGWALGTRGCLILETLALSVARLHYGGLGGGGRV